MNAAISRRSFTIDEINFFKIFPDMSAASAHRRKDFIKIIDSFKAKGAQAMIMQQSKLKVLAKGKCFILMGIAEAQNLLESLTVT